MNDKLLVDDIKAKDLVEEITAKPIAENKESLLKERETDNLHQLIYGSVTSHSLETNLAKTEDSTRYDTAPSTLLRYKAPSMKSLLKKKFVTGQTRDKVMENLMNESDSDAEGKDKEGNAVDKA